MCGVDSVATCVQCGRRACGNHYILELGLTSAGTEGLGTTPLGTTHLTFFDRSLPYAAGYAAGGPACATCRDEAGRAAEGRAFAEREDRRASVLRRVAANPTAGAVTALVDLLRDQPATPSETTDIAAALRDFVVGHHTHDIITVQLTRSSSPFKRKYGKAGATALELSRVPAWNFDHGGKGVFLTADGCLCGLNNNRPGIFGDQAQVCVERGSRCPPFQWVEAESLRDNLPVPAHFEIRSFSQGYGLGQVGSRPLLAP